MADGLIKFFRGVVTLNGSGLDDDGGVAVLVVLALSSYRAGYVTRTEA